MNAVDTTYMTPKQLVNKYDWLTMPTLRRLLFYRDENGLWKHIRFPRPRLLLINESGFLEWIDQQVEHKK